MESLHNFSCGISLSIYCIINNLSIRKARYEMKIQVLVAAMNQKDHSLLKSMNIQSDAIIGNQCDFNLIDNFDWNGYKITYLNFNERGVGLNRNNALMRAQADICLFADDDMIYEEGYPKLVLGAFQRHPDADVIIFNLKEKNPKRYIIKKDIRINYFNYLRYGAARIAVKLSSIHEKGIFFNLCFGGGAKYRHGEDNLFLNSCLEKHLKIYGVPEFIASLSEDRVSTWNQGHDDKYFRDQGILYKTISPRWWWLLCIRDAFKYRKIENISIVDILKKMGLFAMV